MGIKDHKWSDCDVSVWDSKINHSLALSISDYYDDGTARISFNKSDAEAIAKHFNQDRETLVNKIKALIVGFDKLESFKLTAKLNYSVVSEILSDLINESTLEAKPSQAKANYNY